jgi:hypothetical protein
LQNGFLYGLATGVGSTPHQEADQAIDLIKEYLPHGPHWPQLPKRGRKESFVRQNLTPLVKLKMLEIEKDDTPFFLNKQKGWLGKLEQFYQFYLDSLEEGKGKEEVLSFFSFPADAAAGFYAFLKEKWDKPGKRPAFLKGHVGGPLTIGLQISTEDGTVAFYEEELRDIINKLLALISRAQIRELKKHSLPVVIFIDDPAIYCYGQSSFISLSRDDISASIEDVLFAIKAEDAYAGVHCCSGVDWSLLLELPFDIINFDAYNYFDSMLVYAEELNSFLRRGGCLAWGIVPTSEAIEKENAQSLKERFYALVQRLAQKGVDPGLLTKQYLITPSCGTGTLTIPQAEKVYAVTRELQEILYNNFPEQNKQT